MSYNELRQRGTADFPIELYYTDKFHPRYEMVAHWHSDIEIVRIIKGKLKIKLNNNAYDAKAGDVLFVNSETVHGAIPDDCIYECVVFTPEFFVIEASGCKAFIEGIVNGDYAVNEYFPRGSTHIYSAVDKLTEALKDECDGRQFRVIGALYNLFGVIMQNNLYSKHHTASSVMSKNVPKLKRVLAYIRENFDTQITLRDMAHEANMSPKYFCSFFKNMTSKTPVEYLNAYRVERAARKLINSDMSVTDIAYCCGFNDLSYFIKTFKMIKGVTPAKFRHR